MHNSDILYGCFTLRNGALATDYLWIGCASWLYFTKHSIGMGKLILLWSYLINTTLAGRPGWISRNKTCIGGMLLWHNRFLWHLISVVLLWKPQTPAHQKWSGFLNEGILYKMPDQFPLQKSKSSKHRNQSDEKPDVVTKRNVLFLDGYLLAGMGREDILLKKRKLKKWKWKEI